MRFPSKFVKNNFSSFCYIFTRFLLFPAYLLDFFHLSFILYFLNYFLIDYTPQLKYPIH